MRAQEAKIAIYGAGAMGTVLGAFLTKGGLPVHLISRNKQHIEALKNKGATIVCEGEGLEFTQAVNAYLPEEMEGEYDVIFLMTKQRQNTEILKFLLSHLKEDGILCTTQNGLPEPSVANIVGKERAFGGIATFGATFLEGGRVALTSEFAGMTLEIGGYVQGEKLALLTEILQFVDKVRGESGFVIVRDNFLGARWAKLAINSAFSGISAMTDWTFGEIAGRFKGRKIALAILHECIHVANASGIHFPKTQGYDMEKILGGDTPIGKLIAYMVLPFAIKRHRKLKSGMLRDLKQKQACDIDFVVGRVVEEGKKVGVPTPYCEKVLEIVHGIEIGKYAISPENLRLFD